MSLARYSDCIKCIMSYDLCVCYEGVLRLIFGIHGVSNDVKVDNRNDFSKLVYCWFVC